MVTIKEDAPKCCSSWTVFYELLVLEANNSVPNGPNTLTELTNIGLIRPNSIKRSSEDDRRATHW